MSDRIIDGFEYNGERMSWLNPETGDEVFRDMGRREQKAVHAWLKETYDL